MRDPASPDKKMRRRPPAGIPAQDGRRPALPDPARETGGACPGDITGGHRAAISEGANGPCYQNTPPHEPGVRAGVAVRKPQNGLPIFFEKIFDPSRNPKKVGSKRERRERVASAFTSEQRRRRVTFFGKGGTVERVTDFLLIL